MAQARPDLDYAVLVRESHGVYELRIRELLLVVRGPDLQAAYQELVKRKQEIADTVAACGTIDQLPQPQRPEPLRPALFRNASRGVLRRLLSNLGAIARFPEKRSFVNDRRVRIAMLVAAIALILFNPVWTTLRFSTLFGQFLWMQGAHDEAYYFRDIVQEITSGALGVNYRLFSTLLAVALRPLGASSFGSLITIYGLLVPLLAFGAALVLATTWEKWSLGRVIWALLLLFSFDFLGGSSYLIYNDPPAAWLARLVGDQAILNSETVTFFTIHRRPEPQASWIALFLYWALLLNSFLRWRRSAYLLVCVATPFLAFTYINAAVATILVFCLLSFCSLLFYRRPVIVPFVLAIAGIVLAYGVSFALGSTSTVVDRTVFATHLPMLRPSVGFSIAGMIWASVMLRLHGLSPARLAALVFFAMPTILLNQQIVTGMAVIPWTWEIYINYPLIVVGAGLMSGQYLSSFERRHGWRQFLSVGLLAVIGYVLVRGAWLNEQSWSLDNVRSVLFAQLLSKAEAKGERIDAVILPQWLDEPLFLTRVSRGTVVLEGYNTMLRQPVPLWRDDQSFEDHAKAASANFAAGFEALFRSGVSPEQLQANMEAGLKTGNCEQGVSFFFSHYDCAPHFRNFTSRIPARLPDAFPAVVALYRQYLERDAARDLGKHQVLLIRDQPMPPGAGGLIDNQFVGTAEIDMRGTPVRAYAYIQRPKRS
jgi:hypothetical protein